VPTATHRKLVIAHEYLAAAADLYYAGRYFSALGLAGMAEEIFEAVMEARNASTPALKVLGGVLKRRAYQPIAHFLVELLKTSSSELRKRSDGEVYTILNRAKNSAKHGTAKGGKTKGFDLTIEADPEEEASRMLHRAIVNYQALGYALDGVALKFHRDLISRLQREGRRSG
jgi:hypothetical protein